MISTILKSRFRLILYFSLYSLQAMAQSDVKKIREQVLTGDRWVKEQNYEQANEPLVNGLEGANTLRYTEMKALAYKDLAICYINKHLPAFAGAFFDSAITNYRNVNMRAEADAVADIMHQYGLSGKESGEMSFGGIEVGSKGVKLTVIAVHPDGLELSFAIKKKDDRNTNIIKLTPEAFDKSVDAVNELYDTLIRNNIDPENIFIAVSSGVLQEALKHYDITEFKKLLGDRISQTLAGKYKKDVFILDACQEAYWTIRGGVVPRNYQNSSCLFDIGSGNTKGACINNKKTAGCFDLPWASETLSRRIAGMDNKSIISFFRDSVQPRIAAQLGASGEFNKRKYVYLSGGIFWVMTNYLMPDSINAKTVSISKANVDRFADMAMNDFDKLTNPDLSHIADPSIRNEAAKQIKKSQHDFSRESTISGALLAQALYKELSKKGLKPKQFYYKRISYIGWISGYIFSKVNEGM